MNDAPSIADPPPDELTLESDALIEWLRAQASEAASTWPVASWAGDSRIGLVRKNNEDRWGVADGWLFGVADGIGGRPGGELAAESAIHALRAVTAQAFDADIDAVARFLNDTVVAAGAAAGKPESGTTLAAIALRGHYASVFSVGDSRALRWRDGELTQLSVDHSLRTQMLESGIDPDEQARHGTRVDALTSFVGIGRPDQLRRSVAAFRIAAGDRYVLCTDGVHGYVAVETMADALASDAAPAAVEKLLDAAERAGGRDNATAIVIDIGADTEGPDA